MVAPSGEVDEADAAGHADVAFVEQREVEERDGEVALEGGHALVEDADERRRHDRAAEVVGGASKPNRSACA